MELIQNAKSRLPLESLDLSSLLELVHSNNGSAGLQASGDPGSGKSVLGKGIAQPLIADKNSATLILDPAGDMAEDIRDRAIFEGMDEDIVYIDYSDPTSIAPINPLAVPNYEALSEYEREAQLVCRYCQTLDQFLAIWGQSNWEGTPRLVRYGLLFFGTLARMKMSLADGVLFTLPDSEAFQSLAAAAPDLIDRLELNRLQNMKDSERDEHVSSFVNRFRSFFAHPCLRAVFGVSDPDRVISVRDLILQRKKVIVNLSAPNLHKEGQMALANTWLSEWFHVVFSLRREERIRTSILCDELPVFTPSFPLIEKI